MGGRQWETGFAIILLFLAGCAGPDGQLQGLTAGSPGRLVLVSKELPPPIVALGDKISLAITVQNVGDQAATYAFNLLVDGDGKDEETMKIFANATERVALDFATDRTGLRTIQLVATPIDKGATSEVFLEPITVSVEKPAQLEVTNLRLSQTEAPVGTTVNAIATIANSGQRAGQKSFNLLIDSQFHSNLTATLEPGAQTDLTFPFTSQARGTFTVQVDNSKLLTIQFYRPAAFEVLTFGSSTTTPQIGDDIEVFFEIRNTGDRGGTAQVQVVKDGVNIAGSQGGSIYIGPEGTSGVREFGFAVDWKGPKTFNLTLDAAIARAITIGSRFPVVETTAIEAPYNNECENRLRTSFSIKNLGDGTAKQITIRVQVKLEGGSYEDKTIKRNDQQFAVLAIAELLPGASWDSGPLEITPFTDHCPWGGQSDKGHLRVIIEAPHMTKFVSTGRAFDV